jgi:hypothetical protein
VRPMAAALTGALISGVAMYAIGAHAQDRFAMNSAMVGNPAIVGNPGMAYYSGQPLGQPVAYLTTTPQPYAQPVYYTPAPQAAAPAPQVVQRTVAAPRQTVYRTVEPAPTYREETAPRRSLAKTALIIGGSAASGAGVGGIVGGKKGALLGAAIGGGAASIYEASRR